MSIDPKFVELTADVLEIFLVDIVPGMISPMFGETKPVT